MQRILIVEDDIEIQDMLRNFLPYYVFGISCSSLTFLVVV